jgi:hypothetical protein
VADHAHTFSASIFERLMLCPGSAVLSQDAPRTTSAYAEWGTQCHELAAKILTGEPYECFDSEMLEVAQQYVDYVQGLAGDNLWVEQRVSFAEPLGIPADADDGFGTADAIVAKASELIVIDLKTGRGVDVEATDNPQLKCYALGALELLNGLAGDFETVRLVIVQPRAGGVKEWVTSVADLYAWAGTDGAIAVDHVKRALATSTQADRDGQWEEAFLRDGEKQCKFCPAKATCPALRDSVAQTVWCATPATPDEFADMTAPPPGDEEPQWISAALKQVDMIEDWCKAVRAEAERRLMAGDEVPGFKVVQGKKGNRKWVDAAAVETLFKETFRLKIPEMYDLSLISPTSADKLAKAKIIGPRQWAKVTGLITQSEGRPHVAPASDPRPALDVRPVRDDFQDLAGDIA